MSCVTCSFWHQKSFRRDCITYELCHCRHDTLKKPLCTLLWTHFTCSFWHHNISEIYFTPFNKLVSWCNNLINTEYVRTFYYRLWCMWWNSFHGAMSRTRIEYSTSTSKFWDIKVRRLWYWFQNEESVSV